MSDVSLTQTELNAALRGLIDVDIMTFLPDKSVSFPSSAVALNTKALSYTSNLQSLLEFSSLPQANIATFENNSWILDGSFISPSEGYSGGGDSYTGYISNDMTDDNGDYTTDPILTVTLSAAATIEYISVKFAGGIDTSYPKTFKIRTYNSSATQISEHEIDISEETGLPLVVVEIGDTNVTSLEFEFIGTVCPHRRTRLNKILFGKAEQVDPYYLQEWTIDDKASLVADSIPTKTLTYDIIDYDGDYDIDNPGNKIPTTYTDVEVLFTFSMEVDNLWKYAPTKVFNLTDISTSSDGIVTFSCGSILDILTDTYDQDIYYGPRTIEEVMNQLLLFSGLSTDQCVLNDFADVTINVPLPEEPVRELIQKLAFSCGATLLVNDDNKIVFTEKNIDTDNMTDTQKSAIPKFMFNQPDPFESAGVLLEEPSAEALSHTTNIAMYTYDTTYDETAEASEVGSADISVVTAQSISYSAVYGIPYVDTQSLSDQNAALNGAATLYSQHAVVKITWTDEATPPIKVPIYGVEVETTQTTPKFSDTDTLLLDSELALTVPDNLKRSACEDESLKSRTFFYDDWYGAKFKYVCKTRNEYLINAGDLIFLETLYSDGKPSRLGYVLRNSYSGTGDSGEMEVIVLDQ